MIRLFQHILIMVALLIMIKGAGSLVISGSYKQDIIDAKWSLVQANPDINLLFVGSSRIWSGIQPPVVDSVLDRKVKSFNFGVSALFLPYSADHILDRLSPEENGIQYVVLELTAPYIEAQNISRGVDFNLENNPAPGSLTAELVYTNLSNRWHNFLGLKPQLLAYTKRLGSANQTRLVNNPQFDFNGYSISRTIEPWDEQKAIILTRSTKGLMKTMSSTTQTTAGPSNLEILVKRFEAKGVRLIYFLPPLTTSGRAEFISYGYQSLDPSNRLVLDVEAWTTLIEDFSYRKDPVHFNRVGAKMYSEIMGTALQDHLHKFPE